MFAVTPRKCHDFIGRAITSYIKSKETQTLTGSPAFITMLMALYTTIGNGGSALFRFFRKADDFAYYNLRACSCSSFSNNFQQTYTMHTVAMRAVAGSSNSNYCGLLDEGFSVRQGHLAPPMATPDSPRPQKGSGSGLSTEGLGTTLTIPTDKAPNKSPKSPVPQRAHK
uniref:Uncharacterized protein n=1 Tax=Panagrellus redivivus TaxID=6233 RepID=A0A7E4UVH2_PANRE